MTYVRLQFTPSELGFTNPLSERLVTAASGHIRELLYGVIASHDDSISRMQDFRRTHTPLRESSWIIAYKDNSVIITNHISDSASKQFRALAYGNGPEGSYIYARHRNKYGNLGAMKFYDKRNEMWVYRSRVKTISSDVIGDFNAQLRSAVRSGLETAYAELNDWQSDTSTETLGESQQADEYDEVETVEELHTMEVSKIVTDKQIIDFKELKSVIEPELESEHRDMEWKNINAARKIEGAEPIPEPKPAIVHESMYTRAKNLGNRILQRFGL